MLKGGNKAVTRVASVSSKEISLEDSQKNYEGWARLYDSELEVDGYSGPRYNAEFAAELVPKEKRSSARVLDVGAGTGLVAKELKKLGFTHIDALEPCDAMLDVARDQGFYENYLVEYLTADPCSAPANSYDVITGCGIFAVASHVPCDAIIEMIRLVKPGGYIVLTTRSMILTETDVYKDLEPMMARLEAEGKWKKVARTIVEKYLMNYDALIYQYQVL